MNKSVFQSMIKIVDEDDIDQFQEFIQKNPRVMFQETEHHYFIYQIVVLKGRKDFVEYLDTLTNEFEEMLDSEVPFSFFILAKTNLI